MSTGIRGDGSIGKGEIEKPRSSRTVDGLLTEVAGIDVKRTSPTGNSGSEVLMRGVDESRYLVLLDGRPLNGSGVFGGHYVDWSSLSTEDIERVEIIRGAASAEYGNTLGGTINIVTGKGTEKNRVRARSSYGSFNTVNAAVSHSGNLGNIIYDDLSYGYWRSDGYLRNNFAERHSLSGTMDLVLPDDLIVGLGIRYTRQKRGFVVENRKEKDNYDSDHPESDEDIGAGPRIHWYGKPGPFGPVDHSKYWGDGSYWLNKRGQYDVDVRKSFDAFDIRARGFMNRQERTEYYYAVDDESRLVLERYTEPERSGGWSVKVSMPAGRHDVVYGAEGVYLGYGKQEIKSADSSYFRIQPSSYDPPEKASRRHGLFAQGSWRITDALKLGAGLRYDNYWAKPSDIIYEQGLSPKARIRYTISEGFDVEASFGRSYRFPTSPESYWYLAGYDPPGRGDLSPERAIQAEAGVNREFRKGALNLRGYYYDVRDYIRTIFGYRPSRVVYNIDKVILWGVEAEAKLTLVDGLDVFANYTWQDTRKEGDILDKSSGMTEGLSELPENKVNAGIRYTFAGLTSELVMRYVDRRGVIVGDQTRPGGSDLVYLEDFATFDLSFSYRVIDRDNVSAKINFGIENLFDASYEETEGFPMPGRVLTGGMSVKF
jgi:iron complex outermembrane receptor protein